MTQTLKITLPSAVETSENLMKLGEIRIGVTTRVANEVVRMNLNVTKPTAVSILNTQTVQFCDSTGNQLLGTTVVLTDGSNSVYFKTNGEFILSISDKFAINQLGDNSLFSTISNAETASVAVYAELDFKELAYVPYTRLRATDVFSGDLSYIKKTATYCSVNRTNNSPSKVVGELNSNTFDYSRLTFLNLVNQREVKGSVNGLNFRNLTGLRLDNTLINGEILKSNIAPILRDISIINTNVSINLSALSDLTDPSSLISLSGSLAYGDIASLAKFRSATVGYLRNLNLSGDIASINNSVYFLGNDNSPMYTNANSNLSTTFWSNKKTDRQYILACESVRMVTGVDQFINDMSTLELHSSATSPWLKTIHIRGTRTTASDQGVATLANKGVTVVMVAV